MSERTQQELVELIYRMVPYSFQIKDLDWAAESDAVRFVWRGGRYRVSTTLGVDDCSRPGFLSGTDITITLAALLKLGAMDSSLSNTLY